MNSFYTITEKTKVEITVKRSKFIANLYYVSTIEEAEKILKEVRKKYFDAKHNCFAYRIINENSIVERASDDGEPSGTAGAPMLKILQKGNLANVLIVVTRYFGGILLGTGGLVRAYSDSLQEAINSALKEEMVLGEEVEVSMLYSDLDSFKHYCKNNKINILSIEYKENVFCKIEIEEEKNKEFYKDFENKRLNLIDIKKLSKKYIKKSI